MAAGSRSNPLALAVLSCLHERPMHPYEVARTLRRRGKHLSIRLNYGSLYSVVGGLEKRGLVRSLETVREGRRPERTVYEITDAGTRELRDRLRSLVAQPVREYLQFEAALTFLPGLPPDRALDALKERCGALESRIARTRTMLAETTARSLPRLSGLEGEYRMILDEAELKWVRRLIEDMEGGSLEGIEMWRDVYETPTEAREPPGSSPTHLEPFA
jgi:DNA-binding PadR family transcriptional regulator